MKGILCFKGKPEQVAKEIEETIKAYTFLCHLKAIEPTLENVLKFRKEGW